MTNPSFYFVIPKDREVLQQYEDETPLTFSFKIEDVLKVNTFEGLDELLDYNPKKSIKGGTSTSIDRDGLSALEGTYQESVAITVDLNQNVQMLILSLQKIRIKSLSISLVI